LKNIKIRVLSESDLGYLEKKGENSGKEKSHIPIFIRVLLW